MTIYAVRMEYPVNPAGGISVIEDMQYKGDSLQPVKRPIFILSGKYPFNVDNGAGYH